MPKTVLVLCTGNSCRSQMAEVLLNHDLAGQVRAISAGTKPQPRVAEGAIAALKDAGLPSDGLYPKDVEAVMHQDIDLVVTVCDNAKETCPVFPRPVPHLHLPFHDPHGEPLGACRALGVGAPVPIFAQGKARRSAVWSFQTSEPQHRHGQKAAPALRVGRLGGVCGVVSLGHGTTMACATRLASIRPNTQRIPRPKPDRLLESFLRVRDDIRARLIPAVRQALGL